MKKLIIFSIIICISCSFAMANEDEDIEVLLKGFDFSIIEKIWNSVKDYVEKAVAFLKEIGLYDKLIELLEKYGKPYVTQYCTSFKIPENVCTSIIDFLLKLIK